MGYDKLNQVKSRLPQTKTSKSFIFFLRGKLFTHMCTRYRPVYLFVSSYVWACLCNVCPWQYWLRICACVVLTIHVYMYVTGMCFCACMVCFYVLYQCKYSWLCMCWPTVYRSPCALVHWLCLCLTSISFLIFVCKNPMAPFWPCTVHNLISEHIWARWISHTCRLKVGIFCESMYVCIYVCTLYCHRVQ